MKFEDVRDAPEIEANIRTLEFERDGMHHQLDCDLVAIVSTSITREKAALKYEPLLRERWEQLNEAVRIIKCHLVNEIYGRCPSCWCHRSLHHVDCRLNNFLKGLE